MTTKKSILEVSDGKHVMLLYDDDKARTEAAAHLINQGLEGGELCIYASVHASDSEDSSHMLDLYSRITNPQSHIEKGDLQVINFRTYYESATTGNLTPFKILKTKLEQILRRRIAAGRGNKIMVFADAACCLTENKNFNESKILESWWQEIHNEWIRNNQNITVVCPHPRAILEQETSGVKRQLKEAHDIMIDFFNLKVHYHLVRKSVTCEFSLQSQNQILEIFTPSIRSSSQVYKVS